MALCDKQNASYTFGLFLETHYLFTSEAAAFSRIYSDSRTFKDKGSISDLLQQLSRHQLELFFLPKQAHSIKRQ